MGAWSPRHPLAKRREAAELMCGSALTAVEVAARLGVPAVTVYRWNRIHGWRPTIGRKRGARRVLRWRTERIAALARVYRTPGVERGDLAEALGQDRAHAETLFRACGLLDHESGRREGYERPGDLRRALREHVARQIAEFAALLCARTREGVDPRLAGRIDSGRILRDLAGLARLVEELDPPVEPGPGLDRGRPEGTPPDLAALRTEIARRYEAFERQHLGPEAAPRADSPAAS